MAKRILTSAIGLVIFFGALFAGNTVFSCAVVLVMLCMLAEFHQALAVHKSVFWISLVSGAAIGAGVLMEAPQIGIALTVMLYLINVVVLYGKVSFRELYISAFSTIFISLFMSVLALTHLEYDVAGVLLTFVCAWITDSGAYFAGYFFGKHKLVPNLSPKKTIEGAIGGVVCCVVGCLIYMGVLQGFFGYFADGASYFRIGVLGACTSVLAQLGDLTASAVKRECNVKDFGTILPGHGGFMDRFDSVVFIAPVIYYALLQANIF